jgi:AraC-like DNA-binding protein
VDPLSDVLQLLTVEAVLPSRFQAGGRWALAFPAFRHVKFGVVHRGEAWLRAEGEEPVRLDAGDCYVLTGRPYVLASDPHGEAGDGVAAFRGSPDGIGRAGEGDDVVLTSGRFTFAQRSARLLLDVLPSLLVLRAEAESNDALRHALALFAHETAARRPGADLATERLAQIVFVQVLRAGIAGDAPVSGWLRGLGDQRIGAALGLMHDDLARRWTVAELADAAHLSRSAFAARFTRLVGTSPLEHLLRMRMHAAGRQLRRGDETVSAVGAAWGYTSDSAFSNAFKRTMGASPRAWRAAEAPEVDAAALEPRGLVPA